MIRGGLHHLLRLSRAHFFREGCFRDVHVSGASLIPDVVVPPLGESISEGSVAEIVAKQGQQIKVDDVIAQLETDKVTIDCKSAHAGILQQIKVNVGDVVKPGSVIAVVGEGAASAQTQQQPAAPSPATAPPTPQQPAQPSTSAQQGGEEEHMGRKPMIAFPLRVAPNGERISSLPASEVGRLCV
uniref:Lipoamide acyltransferase component of branched-chain alpha-keto acid dehydrogenase complex, mitochondrial n=1 Tax=Dunaliella tertiolecta TaxID=3047 RepID=A0A7S3QLX1_DUNTE